MMLGPEQQYQFITNNRLLSHKSSFQAWKCVSFGCSLLVMMLLLSKYYEVSSDLHLLQGIDRLLLVQETSNDTLAWPPVPIDMVLPATNETNFGMESLESNGTMLMSHMHMSLSRELTGNQLLRQEVVAFIAEFRTAKSTLGLSSLLVAIYIVSWVLMTLAIDDTRISNDISLRNILLLSVFGAIDLAASVGFIMVRVIMFSVKNSSFALAILGTSGLKDTPVKLSADQLTAYTALRLIAMRSCSAYTDLYASTVVALLTVLRLYAIVRAITYYRKLRRSPELSQQALMGTSEHKSIWSSGLYNPPSVGQATHLFAAHHHHLISTPPGHQQHQHQLPEHPGSAEPLMVGQSPSERGPFRIASSSYQPHPHHHHHNLQQQQQQQPQRTMDESTFRKYQRGSLPPTSKLMFSSPQLAQQPPPPPPSPPTLQPYLLKYAKESQQPMGAAAVAASGKLRTKRLTTSNSQSQLLQPSLRHSTAATLNRTALKSRTRSNRHSYTPNANSSAPNLLFMNAGAEQRASSYLGAGLDNAGNVNGADGHKCESDPARRERRRERGTLRPSAGGSGGGRSKLARRYEDETTGTENELMAANFNEQLTSAELHVDSSQPPDLLATSPRHYQDDDVSGRHSSQTIGTAYTLLNPSQLDRIGRRLMHAAASGTAAKAAGGGGGGSGSASRYRHANRYKQILMVPSPEAGTLLKTAIRTRVAPPSQSLARTRRHGQAAAAAASAGTRNSSATSASSASASSPDDDSETDGSRGGALRYTSRQPEGRSALPLREEFVIEADDLKATRLFEVDGKNGPSFLLGKCYKLEKANEKISAADGDDDDDDDDDDGSAESGVTGL